MHAPHAQRRIPQGHARRQRDQERNRCPQGSPGLRIHVRGLNPLQDLPSHLLRPHHLRVHGEDLQLRLHRGQGRERQVHSAGRLGKGLRVYD